MDTSITQHAAKCDFVKVGARNNARELLSVIDEVLPNAEVGRIVLRGLSRHPTQHLMIDIMTCVHNRGSNGRLGTNLHLVILEKVRSVLR